jgi:tryptophan synthase alpha chain
MNRTPRKDEHRESVPEPVRVAARGPIPNPHPPMGISTVRGESARERVDSESEANGGKTLAVYLMAGPETPELAEAAVEGGADLVELGFPFSDPLADGPVIRRAAERALAQGMRTSACLECLASVRERVNVPLVPMTYASLLEAYGYERFAADVEAAGATSLIVADLPAGERPELRRVQLVAPTSTDERIALAAAHTDGWLYLVTVTGTTGLREGLSPALAGLAARARRLADLPLYAGFGISTPGQARAAAEVTDGIVVGSRAVEVAEEGPTALRDYVRSLRVAIDASVGIIGGR